MFCKSLIQLILLFCLTISLPVFSEEPIYVPCEVLVRFDSTEREKSQIEETVSSVCNGTVKSVSRFVPGLTLVKLPDDLTVEEAISQFKNTPGVLYAQPNFIYRTQSTFPNDPNFAQLWGLHNIGQQHPLKGGGTSFGTPSADIDAPQTWRIATDASEIIVAVIDTGVDYNHPDLSANMWTNQEEADGNTGVDDDENGYIDDIYGIDSFNDDIDPMDDMYHGTHCAGIIGAVGNNLQGVTGVCWNVKIMALKFLDNYGYGATADAISCIEYAVDKGAKVLNNSWGGQPDYQHPEKDLALKQAIEAADAAGVLFIAAAGNGVLSIEPDEHPFYPASFDCSNIISVLMTDHDDLKPSLSSYGPVSVDLGAPGVDILSTFPTYQTDAMTIGGYSTNYETIGGTSMATPYVAGACALVWSMKPSLSHLQVKDIILSTVDVIPDLENHPVLGRTCLTGGRLNLYNAVLEVTINEQILSKVDDVNDGNSVLPDDTIYYTISYANPVTDPCDPNYIGTLTSVSVVDCLPDEVTFYSSNKDCYYDEVERTVTWDIGTVSVGDSNSFIMRVRVNGLAEPLGTITNLCALRANKIPIVVAAEITDVNAWCPPVIYVDADAYRLCNGMSWKSSYRDLQYALERVRAGFGSSIWVAGGTYRPAQVSYPFDANFKIVDGVSMFGGFAGNEEYAYQRNLANPSNKSVLTGNILGAKMLYVVRANDLGMQTSLDGFEIEDALSAGLRAENSSLVLQNSTISGIAEMV